MKREGKVTNMQKTTTPPQLCDGLPLSFKLHSPMTTYQAITEHSMCHPGLQLTIELKDNQMDF